MNGRRTFNELGQIYTEAIGLGPNAEGSSGVLDSGPTNAELKTNKTEIKSDNEFFKIRATGAKKIAQEADAKGGPALLTAIHFHAKERPYIQSINNLDDVSFAETKANECLSKLQGWKDMTQEEFQEVMGMLEVYGEVYLHIR